MPNPVPGSQLQYAAIDKPVLPYRSYTSPVDESPHFALGSSNVLASVIGYAEKRPGFSTALETMLSAIPGTIKRMYAWRRWVTAPTNPSAFYYMVCSVTSTTSTVWKYQVGTDTSFTLLYTDNTTTNPFDFVASRDFCFFGNRSTRVNMRKYDGTTCSLWGIDAPLAAPSFSLTAGVLPAGLSFNTTTGAITGTPTVAAINSITFTVTDSASAMATAVFTLSIGSNALEWITPAGIQPIAIEGAAYSQSIVAGGGVTPYTYAIQSGSLPTGLSLNTTTGAITGIPTANGNFPFTLTCTDHVGTIVARAFSIFSSSAAITVASESAGGPNYVVAANSSSASQIGINFTGGTAPYMFLIASGTLPPGFTLVNATPQAQISWSSTGAQGYYPFVLQVTDAAGLISQFNYSIFLNSGGVAITSASMPAGQVGTAYSFTPNAIGGTGIYTWAYSVGSITAQTGYAYGQTFTSSYGHESAMSPLSVNTGLFTNSDVEVSVIESTDPQVTGINLYRTSDGGTEDPASMFLVVSLSNADQNYLDSTVDVNLSSQTGPGLYVNAPPQPLDGLIAATNGRIWGRTGGYAWFTGNEEVTNGIPEECMSNAINGNFYAFPDSVGGMTSTNEGVDIGLDEVYWQVAGQLLSTFQKAVLLAGAGILAPINICVIGNTVFWVDTAKQVFSSSAGEIGEPIRTDLQAIDPMQTFIVYHKSKLYNWLVVLDALNGKLFVYDLDLNQWNTPWLVSGMTAIYSGKTAIGQINLIAAYSTGHVMLLTPGTYVDDNVQYGETIISNLISIVPGRTTSARNHTEVRQTEQFEMEVNNIAQMDGSYLSRYPDYFGALVDDDPTQTVQADFVDLRPYLEPLQYIDRSIQKRYLSQWRWGCKNYVVPGTRVAFQAQWNPSIEPWMMYSFGIAWNTR